MEEKKPKIKNARFRGLLMIIGSAVLAGVILIFSAIIYKKGQNHYRSGEVLGILFLFFVLTLLWIVNGILLVIFGDKKVGDKKETQDSKVNANLEQPTGEEEKADTVEKTDAKKDQLDKPDRQ